MRGERKWKRDWRFVPILCQSIRDIPVSFRILPHEAAWNVAVANAKKALKQRV